MTYAVSPSVALQANSKLETDLKEFYIESEENFTNIIAALYDDDAVLEVGGFTFEGSEKESSAANLALNLELQSFENVYSFGLNTISQFMEWEKQVASIVAAG